MQSMKTRTSNQTPTLYEPLIYYLQSLVACGILSLTVVFKYSLPTDFTYIKLFIYIYINKIFDEQI